VDGIGNESAKVMIAMESDGGLFRPRGLGATTSEGGMAILNAIGSSLLGEVPATEVATGGGGADVNMWRQDQVSTASPLLDPQAEAPGYIDTRRLMGQVASAPRRLMGLVTNMLRANPSTIGYG
jgi:hypothetical protein